MKQYLSLIFAYLFSCEVFAGSLTLEWDAPGPVTGYIVSYGTTQGGPYPDSVTVGNVLTTNLTGLPVSTTICTVVAVITADGAGAPGEEGCGISDEFGAMTVTWPAPADPTGYAAYYGQTPGGAKPNKIDGTLATTLSVTGLTNGQQYCFVVRSVANLIESVDSNEACGYVAANQLPAPAVFERRAR